MHIRCINKQKTPRETHTIERESHTRNLKKIQNPKTQKLNNRRKPNTKFQKPKLKQKQKGHKGGKHMYICENVPGVGIILRRNLYAQLYSKCLRASLRVCYPLQAGLSRTDYRLQTRD